jgi:hypothetical protein
MIPRAGSAAARLLAHLSPHGSGGPGRIRAAWSTARRRCATRRRRSDRRRSDLLRIPVTRVLSVSEWAGPSDGPQAWTWGFKFWSCLSARIRPRFPLQRTRSGPSESEGPTPSGRIAYTRARAHTHTHTTGTLMKGLTHTASRRLQDMRQSILESDGDGDRDRDRHRQRQRQTETETETETDKEKSKDRSEIKTE